MGLSALLSGSVYIDQVPELRSPGRATPELEARDGDAGAPFAQDLLDTAPGRTFGDAIPYAEPNRVFKQVGLTGTL